MALSVRQERLYLHRANIYRAETSIGAAVHNPGASSGWRWFLVAADVPCYFQISQNTSDPAIAGREQTDFIISLDQIYFGSDVDIRDADVVRNVTPGDTRNGILWSIRGVPQLFSNSGRRTAGRKVCKASYYESSMEPPL